MFYRSQKRNRIGALALVTFSMFATAVAADERARDWWPSVILSAGNATIKHTNHAGTIGTGAIIDGRVDGTVGTQGINDVVAGMGLGLARPFGRWVLEGEVVWRYRTDWDVVIPTASLRTVTNVFTNVATTTMFVNVVRAGALSERWGWQLGFGAGRVINDMKGEYIQRAVPGVSEQYRQTSTGRWAGFAWNALVGAEFRLATHWALNLRYRYADLGKLELNPQPAHITADHASHELLLSFTRR